MGIRRRIWDRMYRGVPTWELHGPDARMLSLIARAGIDLPARALDIGCGTGDNAIALANAGFDVTAVDIAPTAIARARAKAEAADITVDWRCADLLGDHGLSGPFDLLADRGLLMSVFGSRARRRYASTVIGLAARNAAMVQFQWELPPHLMRRPGGVLVRATRGFVLLPGELEALFAGAFTVRDVVRTVEPTDDPGMRRLGISEVVKVMSWFTRNGQ